MDTAGRWMHADPPSTYKGSQQPASKQFLRSLQATKYAGPTDVEAAAEGGFCGALIRSAHAAEGCLHVAVQQQLTPDSCACLGFAWLAATVASNLYKCAACQVARLEAPCSVPAFLQIWPVTSGYQLTCYASFAVLRFAACSPALLQTAVPFAAASMRLVSQ